MMTDYHITLNNSTIDHGSSVIHTEYISGTSSMDSVELLQEIKALSNKLAETQPLIASALENLGSAIQEQNKPKVAGIIRQLSSGFASSFLANVASAGLLSFLGISPTL